LVKVTEKHADYELESDEESPQLTKALSSDAPIISGK
jgi:hypothetical protein